MRTFTPEQLAEILAKHQLWLAGEEGSKRANLREADLREADLRGANLRGADLYGADLRGAYLYGADLYGADLRGADLHGADLRGADLHGADLRFMRSADGFVLACMNAGKYQVVAAKDRIAIGCQMHAVNEWRAFDDDTIARMGSGALEWWNKWKELVFAFHANIFKD